MAQRQRNKLGRNDPCFCGSGLKYKKCCLPKGERPWRPSDDVPPEVLQAYYEANRERVDLQAKGIYINLPNTDTFQGKSFMAVGSRLMYENRPNVPNHEMLLLHLQRVLGKEWWEAETAKPIEQQHFIRRCFSEVSAHPFTAEQDLRQETPDLRSFLPTGNLQALMSLAFDVYLLEHKASLPDDWLRRLRHRDQYQGVRHEIAVASIFIRIGCRLEFYPDAGATVKHPEFAAIHDETANKVAVEVKSRHRRGVINRPGQPDLKKAALGDVEHLFDAALEKETDGLPFMVFIDVNAPSAKDQPTAETQWFADIKQMIEAKGTNSPAHPEPYNALWATNYSPHYDGNDVTYSGGYAVVANTHVQHSINGGLQGEFMNRLMQAVASYGFVPKL